MVVLGCSGTGTDTGTGTGTASAIDTATGYWVLLAGGGSECTAYFASLFVSSQYHHTSLRRYSHGSRSTPFSSPRILVP